MKPWIHAENSVKKFGGEVDDYLDIHNWLDQTKAHFPDMRHRAILHSSFGIFLCEQVHGVSFKRKSDGKRVQVRDIAEHHVIEDMGFIPTIQDYLKDMPFYDWLGGKPKKKQRLKLDDLDQFVQKEIPSTDQGPSDWPPGIRVVD
jgi:hypothetical protein